MENLGKREKEAADVLASSHSAVSSSASVHRVSISSLETGKLKVSVRGRLYGSLEVLKNGHSFLKWMS